MAKYKYYKRLGGLPDGIQNTETGDTFIEGESDHYKEYLQWLDDGNITGQVDENPNQWIDDRVKSYPPIGDQLDYIYHNGIDAWKTDIIQPVKDKYPKAE